jgi:hypothetical protein
VAQKPAICAEEVTKAPAQGSLSGFEHASAQDASAAIVRRESFMVE